MLLKPKDLAKKVPTLRAIIEEFNGSKKFPRDLEKLKRGVERFGGIQLLCDLMLLKLHMQRLFKTYCLGENYMYAGADLYEAPTAVQIKDKERNSFEEMMHEKQTSQHVYSSKSNNRGQ